MDGSGLGGGFSSGPNVGMLGHSSLTHQHHHHMNMMTGLEDDHHPQGPALKGTSLNFVKGKSASPLPGADYGNCSEDEEHEYMEDGNGENAYGAKGKNSRWQRMKWTDEVVRLLISVVACVGDDGLVEGAAEGHNKRKAGILQKKGKWKTVSKIMISKGCHVSPQQCEDKFNDLNKRYKRLNDILGRGTSCKVVENPTLMDSMPHLSSKSKDDVRKILSSKHLFYKEMCAYHNGQMIPNSHDFDLQNDHNNGSEEEEGEDHDEHEEDDLDNTHHEEDHHSAEDGHFWQQPNSNDGFDSEMARVFQDSASSPQQRREWIKKQMFQLEEERLAFQVQALDLERQRFKWLRYCSKKNRELERLKLENERMKLENEQRMLQLKHRELEIDLNRSGTAAATTTLNHPMMSLGADLLQGRDQVDLGRS